MYIVKKINFKKILVLVILISITMMLLENFPKKIYPIKYGEYVYKYSEENDLDPYLVFAIIKAESNFDPNAKSHKDAKGLMQLTDTTADWVAEKIGLKNYNEKMLYMPEVNIRLGSWYFKSLLTEFNGQKDLAIAAYNGGSGNVTKWLRDKELSRTGKSLEKIPFRETDNFVKKVNDYYEEYKKLYDSYVKS